MIPRPPRSTRTVTHVPFTTRFRFVFYVYQAYLSEFEHQYVRFYTSTGAVNLDDALNPLELASPYTEDQLFHIRHKQGGDTMFLLHENVFPQRLRRLNTTSWALGPVPWINEPFGVIGVSSARTEERRVGHEGVRKVCIR